MIIHNKTFSLLNKEVFSKITLKAPFEVNNKMNNEACLSYVISGQQETISSINRITTNQGEAVLEKCGNYLTKIKNTTQDSYSELITIHFHPETLKLIYDDKIPDLFKNANNRNPKSNATKIKGNTLLLKYFDSLLFYFDNDELVDNELLIIKLKELMHLLLKTQEEDTVLDILANLFTPDKYSFKEIVTSHLYLQTDINELAKVCALSRSTFLRRFKEEYNQTPANYFRNKKLEKAAELIRLSNNPISTVCFDVGFNNTSHFTRLFQSKYKISPKHYRLKHLVK
ncbi:AraC-like DNA-binding protein [Gillisia sp. Hel_I_86]|uniref:helix-turn-helix domain-containing protein n=1 Tax=Gillisia sp. Hel_I_86 TaxID=1249981 RepID=UPI001198DE44|nr:helix-turn-helix domain-containing protein [Gillisia sp. Hel_I_86]TVZ27897.1 AraC-like DNA-binding protein [Gillisia sp. Hel_I_86]